MTSVESMSNKELVKFAEERYAPAGQIRYFDLAITEGKGALLKDADGNTYIDLLASASAMNTGHCHPKIVAAMTEQMKHLTHYTPAYFYHPKAAELMDRLIQKSPGDFEKKVVFGNSGSDANDGIMKFCRAYTGRPTMVAFQGAYHGDTFGSMSMSACSLNMRRKMEPLVPNVQFVPYPNAYRGPEGETEEELTDRYWGYFEDALNSHIPVDTIAGVLIEPIQGDGGFIKPPKAYMERLYKFCHENGIVFCVDEINQGMGRTGKMWGIDNFGIAPDLMSVGKSFASGMPLSAVVGRKEIMDSLEAPAHVFTTAGNPVCCAASLATFDVLEEEKLTERSATLGEKVKKRFEEMKDRFDFIGDVRIFGLNGGIEIVTDKESKEPDNDSASKIITYLKDHGVLMITVAGNVLRFQPPLVIKEEELEKALQTIEDAFVALENNEIQLDSDRKIGW